MKKGRIILIGIIFPFLLTVVVVCGQQINYTEKYLNEGAEFENYCYFDRALKSYDKALDKDPGNPTVIARINGVIKKQSNLDYLIGKIYMGEGAREKAIGYYEKALMTNPDNTEAKNALEKAIKKPLFDKISNSFDKILCLIAILTFSFFLYIIIRRALERRNRRKKKIITIEPFENFSVENNVDQGKMVSQLVIEKLPEMAHGVYAPKILESAPLLPSEGPKELKTISALIDWLYPLKITRVTGRYQESKSKGIGITVQLINVKTKKIESVNTLWEEEYVKTKAKESESNKGKPVEETTRNWEPLAELIAYWISFCESEYKPNDFQCFLDVQKGDSLFSDGNFYGALEYYEKAIRSEKNYAKAYHNMGYIYEIKGGYYLFSWDDVPGDYNERLLRILLNDYHIRWAKNAKIWKSPDGKTIRIFKDENSAEIVIDVKEKQATLTTNDCIYSRLKVEKEYGKLNIYKKGYKEYYECYNKSVECYNKAVEYYKHAIESGYKTNIHLSYFNLGNVYRYRSYNLKSETAKGGHLEDSKKYFKKSHKSSKDSSGFDKGSMKRRVKIAKACTDLLLKEKKLKNNVRQQWLFKLREPFVIKMEKIKPLSKKKAPSILYLLANYYSLASGILVKQDKQNEQYVTKSLEYLEEAIRREKYLRIMAKKDPDFDNIKNEDFYELTQE